MKTMRSGLPCFILALLFIASCSAPERPNGHERPRGQATRKEAPPDYYPPKYEAYASDDLPKMIEVLERELSEQDYTQQQSERYYDAFFLLRRMRKIDWPGEKRAEVIAFLEEYCLRIMKDEFPAFERVEKTEDYGQPSYHCLSLEALTSRTKIDPAGSMPFVGNAWDQLTGLKLTRDTTIPRLHVLGLVRENWRQDGVRPFVEKVRKTGSPNPQELITLDEINRLLAVRDAGTWDRAWAQFWVKDASITLQVALTMAKQEEWRQRLLAITEVYGLGIIGDLPRHADAAQAAPRQYITYHSGACLYNSVIGMVWCPPPAEFPIWMKRESLPAVTPEFINQAAAFLGKAKAFHKGNAAAIAKCERDYLQMSLDALEKLLAEAQQLIPLPIEFPAGMNKSYTSGPPKKVRFAPGTRGDEPPPKVMVPKGIRNVAFGKKVTSSTPEPAVGTLDMITDGKKSGLEGTRVEIGPGGKQWVQVDLGQEYEVFAVAIWRHPYTWEPHVYRDVVVLLASDAEMSRNVRYVFNNDQDNSLGLGKGRDFEYFDERNGKIIPCFGAGHGGVRARYLRSWTNGHIAGPDVEQEMTQYVEIEVWGLPVDGAKEESDGQAQRDPAQPDQKIPPPDLTIRPPQIAAKVDAQFSPQANLKYEIVGPSLYKADEPGPAGMVTSVAWSLANEFVYRTALAKKYALPAAAVSPDGAGFKATFKPLGSGREITVEVDAKARTVVLRD